MTSPHPVHALHYPLVVATVHTRRGIALATKATTAEADVLELRLDLLEPHLPALRKALPNLDLPLLITARHPSEGGATYLSLPQRIALLEEFLPSAAWLDIELRQLARMRPLYDLAASSGVRRVLSSHHFRNTPASPSLAAIVSSAGAEQPDVVKIATKLRTPQDLAQLLMILRPSPRPTKPTKTATPAIAAMGMGDLGAVSRLTLGRCGSVLNYGFLDQPQVVGQWPAATLKKLLGIL